MIDTERIDILKKAGDFLAQQCSDKDATIFDLRAENTALQIERERLCILLRETAVNIERWSRSQFISCDRSDAMEAWAGKLRAAEKALRDTNREVSS